jgi:hypothetical protein
MCRTAAAAENSSSVQQLQNSQLQMGGLLPIVCKLAVALSG